MEREQLVGTRFGNGGVTALVNALAVSGSTLYAGGYFTTAGNVTKANYIAQWNGSSWSALGSGMGGAVPFVAALAVSGGTLYAGGDFRRRAAIPLPITSRNGTGAIGRRWVRG